MLRKKQQPHFTIKLLERSKHFMCGCLVNHIVEKSVGFNMRQSSIKNIIEKDHTKKIGSSQDFISTSSCTELKFSLCILLNERL